MKDHKRGDSVFVLDVHLSGLIQETADMLKSHLEDTVNTDGDVYEAMSNNSQDMMMKYSGSSEDIYESMLKLDPDCAEDLCKLVFFTGKRPQKGLTTEVFPF